MWIVEVIGMGIQEFIRNRVEAYARYEELRRIYPNNSVMVEYNS
jgi:hypothetical protein